jgi:hypothetical protein
MRAVNLRVALVFCPQEKHVDWLVDCLDEIPKRMFLLAICVVGMLTTTTSFRLGPNEADKFRVMNDERRVAYVQRLDFRTLDLLSLPVGGRVGRFLRSLADPAETDSFLFLSRVKNFYYLEVDPGAGFLESSPPSLQKFT